MSAPSVNADVAAIRAVVDAWILLRDTGDWAGLAACWHAGGTMSSTRYCGPADAFVAQTRAAFERGANVQHMQCGFLCEVAGDRAIAQVRMQIRQRAPLHGMQVEATCTGRFYDFFEKREGRWAIVRRQPVYEVDRLDTVEPGARLELDAALLAQFPASYRHLAYLQTHNGFEVQRDLPELRGPRVEALYEEGRRWLQGGGVRAAGTDQRGEG
ncbi:nuclear transport factor 2 family protein [Paraburkholderia sp. J12]|uniref:nuclear transport factor 2 family protein n=1 Tax=Paraburkholderia sp. J12 TaxID=2805432 RepID=UPI002ABE9963|nr:nuclear transport factor 2 family protein [Paraburkholderia sp. J12]